MKRPKPDDTPGKPGMPPIGPETTPPAGSASPRTTGRHLILFREGATRAGIGVLSDTVGVRVVNTADFDSGLIDEASAAEAGAIVFDKLNAAVVSGEPDQIRSLRIAGDGDSPILAIAPEKIVYTASLPGQIHPPYQAASRVVGPVAQYLQGYRDAVVHLTDTLLAPEGKPGTMSETMAAAFDESQVTWGLQITNVIGSQCSGRGINVAILDTGFDLNHPDFLGRNITSQSFVSGEPVQDGVGHGTHCTGTACGPLHPGTLPRYGIAYNAAIFIGKVLNNLGQGVDGDILNGINWAVTNKFQIVSMSFGAAVQPGATFDPVLEGVAQRALAAGVLLIAAAGNESDRRVGYVAPVDHPANCPSIMAIGAVDQNLQAAFFSNGGINPNGGQVDLVAPGVDVRSSWPLDIPPTRYNTISGTSMATPHVAGIAALHAQATGLTGSALWARLTQTARRMPLPSSDVGAGLVQAPPTCANP